MTQWPPTGPTSKCHRTGATVSHAFMGDLRDTLCHWNKALTPIWRTVGCSFDNGKPLTTPTSTLFVNDHPDRGMRNGPEGTRVTSSASGDNCHCESNRQWWLQGSRDREHTHKGF